MDLESRLVKLETAVIGLQNYICDIEKILVDIINDNECRDNVLDFYFFKMENLEQLDVKIIYLIFNKYDHNNYKQLLVDKILKNPNIINKLDIEKLLMAFDDNYFIYFFEILENIYDLKFDANNILIYLTKKDANEINNNVFKYFFYKFYKKIDINKYFSYIIDFINCNSSYNCKNNYCKEIHNYSKIIIDFIMDKPEHGIKFGVTKNINMEPCITNITKCKRNDLLLLFLLKTQ